MIDGQLKQALSAYKLKYGLSWEGLAKKIGGISGSSLNLLINDKYPSAKTDKVELKLKKFIDTEYKKDKLPVVRIPFVTTQNSEIVFGIAADAHAACSINVVVSEPGYGKTMAAKEYSKTNPAAIFMEAQPNMSAKVLFNEILLRLNINVIGHMSGMFKETVQQLRNSGRLLMVDEAESLSYGALEYTRRLYDLTKVDHVPTMGIVLLGDKRLTSNLRGYQSKYKRLFSRVGWLEELSPYSLEDTTNIFRSVYPNANEEACETLYNLTRGSGRAVEMIIKNVKRLQAINENASLKKLVQSASRGIML